MDRVWQEARDEEKNKPRPIPPTFNAATAGSLLMHLTSKYLEGKKPADIIALVKEMGRNEETSTRLTTIHNRDELQSVLDEMKVDLRPTLDKAREVVGTSNIPRLNLSSFAGFEQFNDLEIDIVDTTYSKYTGPNSGMSFLFAFSTVGLKSLPCLAVQLHLLNPPHPVSAQCTIM
jgi:hypothetical protein